LVKITNTVFLLVITAALIIIRRHAVQLCKDAVEILTTMLKTPGSEKLQNKTENVQLQLNETKTRRQRNYKCNTQMYELNDTRLLICNYKTTSLTRR